MKEAELSLAKDVEARLERVGKDIDNRALTPAEKSALSKFAALEPAWKAIIARRDEIEKLDASKRAELGRLVNDFSRALDESERAWSSAREARLDDRDAATMHRARRRRARRSPSAGPSARGLSALIRR